MEMVALNFLSQVNHIKVGNQYFFGKTWHDILSSNIRKAIFCKLSGNGLTRLGRAGRRPVVLLTPHLTPCG